MIPRGLGTFMWGNYEEKHNSRQRQVRSHYEEKTQQHTSRQTADSDNDKSVATTRRKHNSRHDAQDRMVRPGCWEHRTGGFWAERYLVLL